jgi:hypothetical protein
VYEDGSVNPYSCFARQSLRGLLFQAVGLTWFLRKSAFFNPEGYDGWSEDNVREVDIVAGVFMLIRRSLWEQLGGFNTTYWLYGEDADFCLRARRLGARPVVTHDATIVHHGVASSANAADSLVHLLRAKRQLIRDHWPLIGRPIGLFLLSLWPITRSLIGPLAGLVGYSRVAVRSAVWRQVLGRRGEWTNTTSQRAMPIGA